MNTTTKLLAAGLAGMGLLLTACEIPGSGPPLNIPTVVTPNREGRTEFSGYPAVFKGTNIVTPGEQEQSQGNFLSFYDAFFTLQPGEVTLRVTCDVYDADTYVYVDHTTGDNDDDYFKCTDGPTTITTLDSSESYLEIGTESQDPGFHAYKVRFEIVDDY